ncbi:MAG: rod shape-determining protein MreC [Prevotellaceae bacterium]|jgi:rod shape-determining protein MreC|nr:rod shape-determining protein MreC [Prevotellaceae bacterium]
MNNLLKFILRFHDFILFLILEGAAFALIANSTYYQQTQLYSALQITQNYFFELLSDMAEYTSLRGDNAALARENARLRNQLDYYVNHDTAKTVTRVDPRNGKLYTYIPAKVANLPTNKQNNFLILNVGEWDGIRSEMGVISDNSIVGIVINTSAHYSTVMSLLNRDFKISARLKRTGYLGSLIWDGHNYQEALLTEVPQHVKIAVGDTVETSGYSAMFPEGIQIGQVLSYETKKGNFYNIRIKLDIDFKRLRHVKVVRFTYQAEQRSLERNLNLVKIDE